MDFALSEEHSILRDAVRGWARERARVAESADAPGLGPGGHTPLGVRLPPLAPRGADSEWPDTAAAFAQ